MPEPGGGPHSGGGGGYHGGRMHESSPRRMYRSGWRHRPRFYGRSGCFGSLVRMIMFPVILIIIVFMILFSSISSAFSVFSLGGVSNYDDNKFQDYAVSQYVLEFENSTSYEDNLLLIFLIDDKEYYNYYYIAWVGDHINTSINYMFGNESTVLGQTIVSSINTNSYKYSLNSNLVQVIEIMENKISSLGLESSFTCNEEHVQVISHLTNNTSLALTEETVNASLESFTDTTGIPIVVVLEDIAEVFPKQIPIQSIIMMVILIILIAVVIYLIVRNRKNDMNGKQYNDYKDCYWEEKIE